MKILNFNKSLVALRILFILLTHVSFAKKNIIQLLLYHQHRAFRVWLFMTVLWPAFLSYDHKALTFNWLEITTIVNPNLIVTISYIEIFCSGYTCSLTCVNSRLMIELINLFVTLWLTVKLPILYIFCFGCKNLES